MEHDLDTTPFVRIERLKEALAEAGQDNERKAYLEQIVGYADLVLGTSWRS
jgi:hypothetical protein